jgi:NarL family two-component system sensor histidine kinase YdfH
MKKPFALLHRQDANPEPFVEWPFFVLLTFAFGFVYVESLITTPALREPSRLVLFTVLMCVHIALHWLSVRLLNWKQAFAYLVIQGALAFIITFMVGNIGPLLGLYMGLIGETIGLLREKPRWAVAAVSVFLALSFVNYGLQVRWIGWYWWLLAMGPMTFFVAVYVTLYSRQSEARARAQTLLKDLESANRQLSDYAAQVEDLTLVNERQRMARELHDTLSQGLAGLILQLEAVDAHLASNRVERGRSILQQSMEKARGALAEARQAIDDLRKPAEHNLVEAVLQESERFTSATGIACAPQIDIRMDVNDLVAETAIRAISECLTNTARHARANHLTLRLTGLEKELEIEIWDDGVGFNPEAVSAGHYGLLGMHERVRMAGGNLKVKSEPGKGTWIVIRFPLLPLRPSDPFEVPSSAA